MNPLARVRVPPPAALFAVFLASACSDAAPGRANAAPVPELTMEDRLLRDRLHAHVHELAGRIGERNAGTYENLEQARRYIEREFEGAGYEPRLQSYTHEGRQFHNIEVTLAGQTDTPMLVVGAHYDSVTGSPGANDNATGVAVVLELARALASQRLPATIRFVAFANEEPPYFNTRKGMGSIEYVRRIKQPWERIRGMISVETVGYYSDESGSQRYPGTIGRLYPDKGNFIGFVADDESRDLVETAAALFRRSARLPSEVAAMPASVPGIDWSDHRSFRERDVPAIMVTDTATFRDPHYHRAGDTPERLDYDRITLLTRGLVEVVTGLAQAP